MEGLGVFRAIQCLTPEGRTIAERSGPDFTAVHESAVPAPADQNDGQETRLLHASGFSVALDRVGGRGEQENEA